MQEEIEFSVVLLRNRYTFAWLDKHSNYHTDNDVFDYETVLVSFETAEEALTAAECLLEYGNYSIH